MAGKDRIDETPQQAALREYASNQLRDYEQRWAPVQRELASQIQRAGAPASAQREMAAGKAATDASIAFSKTQGAVEKALAGAGVNPASSRAKLATVGVAGDEARTRGIGAMVTDQMVDDAYMQGLTALTSIGRGERATVASGLASQAQTSAREAQTSAEVSAMNRAGNAELAGQAIGAGIYQGFNKPPPQTTGTGMGLYSGMIPSGVQM